RRRFDEVGGGGPDADRGGERSQDAEDERGAAGPAHGPLRGRGERLGDREVRVDRHAFEPRVCLSMPGVRAQPKVRSSQPQKIELAASAKIKPSTPSPRPTPAMIAMSAKRSATTLTG